ncbi:hypothetical protein [Streptomyces mirabilis]
MSTYCLTSASRLSAAQNDGRHVTAAFKESVRPIADAGLVSFV